MSRTSSSSSSPRSMMEMEESEMRHAFFLRCGDGERDSRSISWGGGRLRTGDGGDADMIHMSMFWATKYESYHIASIFIIR